MTLPFGGEVIATTGAVRSIFTAPLVTDAVLPARSVAVPLAVWFAPSVDSCASGPHVAMPDPESAQVKWIETGLLFQPLPFGAGDAAAVMTGAVLSMFKLTLAVAVCPATSVTVPVTTWSRPSVVTVTGAAHAQGGAVDWPLVTTLLLGSIPGISLGTWMAPRAPVRVLRVGLASLLLITGWNLI